MDQDIKERMGSTIQELLTTRHRLSSKESSSIQPPVEEDERTQTIVQEQMIKEGKTCHDFNWAWVYYIKSEDRWQ